MKFFPSILSGLSTWMLKSPRISNFPDEVATLSAYAVKSCKKSLNEVFGSLYITLRCMVWLDIFSITSMSSNCDIFTETLSFLHPMDDLYITATATAKLPPMTLR